MKALVLSLVALSLPAAFAERVRRRPGASAFLDGLVVAAIGGLLALDVLPEAGEAAGPWALVALAAGLAVPLLAERFGVGGPRVHDVGILAGQAVLMVHATLDGVALATAREVGPGLAAAVVLHQVPVGLAVWASTAAHFGARGAWLSLGSMAALTVGGFVAGERALAAANPLVLGVAAGAAAGSLAHVVAHGPLPGSEGRPRLAGAGAVVAAAAVLGMAAFGPESAIRSFCAAWAQVAPFALLALAIASLPLPARIRSVAPEGALLAVPFAGWETAVALAALLLALAPLAREADRAAIPRLVGGLLCAAAAMPALGSSHQAGTAAGIAIAAGVGVGLARAPWFTVPLGAALAGELHAGAIVALVIAGLPLRIGRLATGVLALVLGFCADSFLPDPGAPVHVDDALAIATGLLLAAVAVAALVREGPRAWLARAGSAQHPHDHPETP